MTLTTGCHVSDVLAEIQLFVRELGLPEPTHNREITPRTISLEFHTPAEVDAWQRHLCLPPGTDLGVGQYAAVAYPPSGSGWCGAVYVALSCPLPTRAEVSVR